MAHVRVDEHRDSKFTDDVGAKELRKRIGGGGGLPWFAFLTAKGDLIVNSNAPPANGKKGGNIGFPAEPHEVDWFLEMVKQAVPRIATEELAAIEKILRAPKK